ncbi:MAG: nucleotidyltransferase domain-containing protein [Actinomycetota bacterium]
MSEAVFHRLDHAAVVAELEAFVRDELACRPEVRRVVLIGSLARGDWSARSDADLVVVVDDEPGAERADYAPHRRVGVPIDIFVWTAKACTEWSARFRAEVEAGRELYAASRL